MHITNKISKYFHLFASTEFYSPIQNIINHGYVKLLGLDMSEFRNASSYKTLNELFTRALVKPRKVDKTLDTFISPADSFVSEAGEIKDDIALQIKGMKYSVKNLFTEYISTEELSKIQNGTFMNFYLSPKDYHRYHCVYNSQILKLIHVPGKLYPVNFKYLNKQDSLFVENERVIAQCKTLEGKMYYMVFVGALNVGKMAFDFEPKIETNSDKTDITVYEYDNLFLNKGDCMGHFKMGSTVLLFWEKDMVEIESLINQPVRFTQVIANLK
jgi:phosphatidylserine decarboxylase